MAVTLTSTGITFSDGTSCNTAPSAGGMTKQVFNNSATWSHSGAGSPSMVLAYGVGGSGSAQTFSNGYNTPPDRRGGAGGAFVAEPVTTNGNIAVTIGNGGAANNFFCGYYNYSCARGQTGGTTNVGGITGNGGGAWYSYYSTRGTVTTGNPGSGNGIAAGIAGTVWAGNYTNSTGTHAGKMGKAYIVW